MWRKHRMKTIYALLCPILLWYGFSINDVKPKVSIECKGIAYGNTRNAVIIQATIANTSADTISFWSMSCSKSAFFTCSNRELPIEVEHCKKNGFIRIKLAPHQLFKVRIELNLTKELSQLKSNMVKIGFIYVEAITKIPNPPEIENAQNDTDNIIWSNEITLKE